MPPVHAASTHTSEKVKRTSTNATVLPVHRIVNLRSVGAAKSDRGRTDPSIVEGDISEDLKKLISNLRNGARAFEECRSGFREVSEGLEPALRLSENRRPDAVGLLFLFPSIVVECDPFLGTNLRHVVSTAGCTFP